MTDESSPAGQMPSTVPPDPKAMAYLGVWAEGMAGVLGQIAGSAFPVQALAEPGSEALSPSENDLYAVITASGALRGELSLRMPPPVGACLAQLLLGETPDPAAEYKPEHKEVVEELLRQVAGHVATAVKPQWGEVQLTVEVGAPPAWPAGSAGWLTVSAEAPFRFSMECRLSPALVAALQSAREEAKAAPNLERSSESPPSSPGLEGNLDLLMDVELEVTLRFGERSMLLREVLELGAGSVVELDRNVDEPVDLLLDGRLIARGEVVVVDGDYGLRVLEIMPSRMAG